MPFHLRGTWDFSHPSALTNCSKAPPLVAARRTRFNSSPHAATIKLDSQSIGGIDRALVPALNPNVTRPVNPGARGYANFVHEIEVPAVLRDYCWLRSCAVYNAPGRVPKGSSLVQRRRLRPMPLVPLKPPLRVSSSSVLLLTSQASSPNCGNLA